MYVRYGYQNFLMRSMHLCTCSKIFVSGGGTYVRAVKYSYAGVALTYVHQNIRTWWWHVRNVTKIFVRWVGTYVRAGKYS